MVDLWYMRVYNDGVKMEWPRRCSNTPEPGPQKGLKTVDTNRVPQPRHDDDTVEAHYACLERPCACLEGWVFVGYIDEHGEEREGSYVCRRCTDSPSP
jgi:hypothetical protein